MPFGTIIRRKNGKYTATPNRGMTLGKKGRNGSKTFATKAEAKKYLSQIQTEQLYGTDVAPNRMTVADGLNQWVEAKTLLDRLKKTTLYFYNRIIVKYLIPELGAIKLQELKASQVQRYFVEKAARLSGKTMHQHYVILHAMCADAVRQDILAKNPVDKVRPPKVIHKEVAAYKPQMIKRLLCEIRRDKLLLPVVTIAIYLAMRRGEIMGLTWSCIDFDKQELIVMSSRVPIGAEVVEDGVKTSKSRRRLHIPDTVLSMLKEQKRQQEQNRCALGKTYYESDLVIVKDDGTPYAPISPTLRIRKVCDRLQIPRMSIHGMRHSFASIAAALGVPLSTISEILGHARISITSDFYTHSFEEQREQGIVEVASVLDEDKK